MSSKAPNPSSNTPSDGTSPSGARHDGTSPGARHNRTTFAPGLYMVATPIGNARDISLRALDLLRCADIIACEDTRVTAKLLTIHGIKTPTVSYHDHNAERQRPKLIERLKKGAIVAQVTDAGTPLISDPGLRLVQDTVTEGLPVTSLPGPSAVLNALVLAGLATDRFFFQGFLPQKKTARQKALEGIKAVPSTLVFLESAKRLGASLADMAGVLGDREGAVLREMTKKFEEVRRGQLNDLARHYKKEGPPKGEVVVVVGPGRDEAVEISADELDRLIDAALETMSVRDAAQYVTQETDLRKKDVYARTLERAKQNPTLERAK